MILTAEPVAAPLLVACLCAQWCGVCQEFRSQFEQLQARLQTQLPQARFLWIDVEDQADLLDPLDVEDFPTLLLASAGEPRFFGPIRPQAEALERLIRTTLLDQGAPALTDPQLQALLGRVRAGATE